MRICIEWMMKLIRYEKWIIISIQLMSQKQQSFLLYSYAFTKDSLIKFSRFLKALSAPIVARAKPLLSPLADRIHPYLQKSKEFYEQHKLIILVVGAVTITYFIVRPAKDVDSKEKRRKQVVAKRQIGNKIFISDNSEAENHEEPSTGTRREVESSEREVMQKKKVDNKYLERIQSSSQEEESGDKIFFEVYKTYQVSGVK